MTTAFVSVVAAILTLVFYPLALFVLTHGAGTGRAGVAAYFYSFMFSKVGIAIVVAAGVMGFCLGSERIANIFSFCWGTHSWWRRFGADLKDKEDRLRTDYNIPLSALAVFLIVVFAFVIWKYAA